MEDKKTSADRLRVGGVVLLREDGAVLLQLRDVKPGLSAAGLWVFPGGHCEPGESCRDCALREFREETGYLCSEIHALTEFDYRSADTQRDYFLSFWWERYDGVQPVQCFEGQEVRFIPRPEAALHPLPDYLPRVWDLALAAQKKTLPPEQTTLLTSPLS